MLGGGRSYQVARVFGIRIGVDLSWLVVLFIFLFYLQSSFRDALGSSDTTAYVTALAAAACFFGSILLHELGHAWAAQRSGIGVVGIDLWMFGGLTKMTRDTDTPGVEFKVAAAGPAVTLLIAAVTSAIGVVLTGSHEFFDAAALRSSSDVSPVELVVSFIATMNVALFVLNIIPAYPLDGGRIARAAIWRFTGSRTRARRLSGRIGQVFGYGVIAFGLFIALRADDSSSRFNGLWYAVLGWLLASSAGASIKQAEFQERIEDITVADVMDAEPVVMRGDLTATQAWEDYFLRYGEGWPWFAVVDPDGRFLGLAQRAAVEHAALREGGAMTVASIVSPTDVGDAAVLAESPIEDLLGSDQLRARGALMAVDAHGILRGVITNEMVHRAIAARLA